MPDGLPSAKSDRHLERTPSYSPVAYSSEPRSSESKLYDAGPPPGFKTLKKTREMKTRRRTTSGSSTSCRTSSTGYSLGDGFSGDEAKPLRDKSDGSCKKRKRCEPSPILGTLEAVLMSHCQEDVSAKVEAKSRLVTADRKIMQPLRPSPARSHRKIDMATVGFICMEPDDPLICGDDGDYEAEFEAEKNGTVRSCSADDHDSVQAEPEWDCSVPKLPSLRWA